MLRSKDTFWKDEREAPLLTKNRGFLKINEDNQEILDRAQHWPSLMGDGKPHTTSSFKDFKISGEPERIFVKDAERTFFGDKNRQDLILLLSYLKSQFGDYAQALSYAASYLLLFHDVQTVIDMLVRMNFDEKYLPGYWKTEAVGFATDAYVFEHLLKKFNPKVQQHLTKNFILPETYVQKWFSGLGIHVLPFEALPLFFENFLKHGYKFLFQFALSLIDHLQEPILKANNPNEIYALLRLDVRSEEDKAISIIEKAHTYNLDDVDFKALRAEMYETKLRARMESARKAALEREASDSDDDDNEDDEEGEECGICNESVPDFYCPTCKVILCENCHDDSKGGHSKKEHKVKSIDDVDLEALTKELGSLSMKK